MLDFVLSSLLLIVQIVIFIVIWSFLLLGTFAIVCNFVSKRFNQTLSSTCGLVATSSLLFQLFHLAYKYYDECNSEWCFFGWFCRSPQSPGRWMWRLDVVSVVAHVIENLVVIVARCFGRTMGMMISSMFSELSWILFIPSLLLTSSVIIFGIFALFGYELNILGILRITPVRHHSPSSSSLSTWSPYVEKKQILPKPVVDGSIKVVKELYQRAKSHVQ